MQTATRSDYFDRYWSDQDSRRVSDRARWRAQKLYLAVGNQYRRVLDVGAGRGDLLRIFDQAGCDVEGWDISPMMVDRLMEAGFEAKGVDIESDSLTGKFDLICCCEVLQQITDPAQVVSRLVRILNHKGRLCISVPNEFHLLRRLGIGKPVESHVSLFSPGKARDLIKQLGLKVEWQYTQPLLPPRWGRVLSALAEVFANVMPSLFSLSNMYLLRRADGS